MLDVDVPHIYYLHVYGPDGLSTEIGFLILDEISDTTRLRLLVLVSQLKRLKPSVRLKICLTVFLTGECTLILIRCNSVFLLRSVVLVRDQI